MKSLGLPHSLKSPRTSFIRSFILIPFMTPVDLDVIRSRINRAFRSAQQATGEGYETSYLAEGTDFMTHFRAPGVKAPELLEDDFLNLFIWTWSLKDYLKICFKARGFDPQQVEDIANRSRVLAYVSDIANRTKHGTLRTSRSEEFAELVGVGFEAPQESIAQISVAGPNVTLVLKDPKMIRICATVRTSSGKELDALAVLTEAMDTWDRHAIAQLVANPAGS